ncbi:hypothetical protein ACS0TY_031338 [Phlomoides rotata]
MIIILIQDILRLNHRIRATLIRPPGLQVTHTHHPQGREGLIKDTLGHRRLRLLRSTPTTIIITIILVLVVPPSYEAVWLPFVAAVYSKNAAHAASECITICILSNRLKPYLNCSIFVYIPKTAIFVFLPYSVNCLQSILLISVNPTSLLY